MSKHDSVNGGQLRQYNKREDVFLLSLQTLRKRLVKAVCSTYILRDDTMPRFGTVNIANLRSFSCITVITGYGQRLLHLKKNILNKTIRMISEED